MVGSSAYLDEAVGLAAALEAGLIFSARGISGAAMLRKLGIWWRI